MRLFFSLCVLWFSLLMPLSYAQASTPETQVITKLKGIVPPEWTIDRVRLAEFGLFEVIVTLDKEGVQKSVFYTNADADFLMSGALIDTHTREDIAANVRNKIFFHDQESLYKDVAVTQVRGDGSRRVVIFEDPNCTYCKKLHVGIAGLDNVTIQTVLVPIFGDDSIQKTNSILCSADPAKTFNDWMVKNISPPVLQCDAAKEKISIAESLAQTQRMTGTPTIYFANGQRIPGMIDLDAFKVLLDQK